MPGENSRPFNWLPKVTVDSDTGGLYVLLREGHAVRTVRAHSDDDLGEFIDLDLDATGHVLGLEIL